ncbi:hypothetical protein [Haloparvum sp. PAK95]|uniref:Nmad3 family putative nucleotide modification protein n=1 Tax=Haloparvum sp. PAK95 TaxID=3418962 RepID=UPI003D2EB12A
MPRSVAINVAANTNEPGFRGPVYPDGSFVYVPIPEAAPTRDGSDATTATVPTYADLDLPFSLPADLAERPVHLDPEFPGVHGSDAATYGDPYGVKASRIAALDPGDWLFFYATLTLRPSDWRGPGDDRGDDWLRDAGVSVDDNLAPEWGAYLVGGFRVAEAVEEPEREAVAERFASNAHLQRADFDARVLVRGAPEQSGLFDRVVPLSSPAAGADANRLVTELSSDSGKGPWWRRPLAFDASATATVLERADRQ